MPEPVKLCLEDWNNSIYIQDRDRDWWKTYTYTSTSYTYMYTYTYRYIHIHCVYMYIFHQSMCICIYVYIYENLIYIWISAGVWRALCGGEWQTSGHRVWPFLKTGTIVEVCDCKQTRSHETSDNWQAMLEWPRGISDLLQSWESRLLISACWRLALTQMWHRGVSLGQQYKSLSLARLCPEVSTSRNNEGQ